MFGKKKKEESEEDEDSDEEEKEEEEPSSSPASLGQVIADLEKLKAKFTTFYEINKAATERFTRINEQIGELRTMLMERDKDSRMLEAKATQAIDMVESVQPDKLMIEVRKQDAKIEALKANLESNEIIMNNAISELKNIRNKMQAFTGMEQVIKMSEEVKKELMETKKTDVTISRHADKVETIFSEIQKRFSGFEKFGDNLKDLDSSLKDVTSDLDSLKTRTAGFANKKDVEDLLTKFNNFEKQVSGIMSLAGKKFENFEKGLDNKFSEKMVAIDKLLKGFEGLAEKVPDLDKYFNLLEEEAKKAPQEKPKVEKIKVPGVEEKQAAPEEKQSLFGKLKDKMPKIGK